MSTSVPSSFRSRLATLAIALFTAITLLNLQPVQAQNTSTSKQTVNVNTADLTTLETLPGIGPTTAQHIIDGRPYKSIADLEKVKGLGKTKADALKGQVTFGSTSATKSTKSASTSQSHKSSSTATGAVNVNTADLATLETLPGVGAATAQHIVDGRPYGSLTDLEKVKGLGKTKVEAMKDQITFGSTSASTSSKKKSKSSSSTAASGTSSSSSSSTTASEPQTTRNESSSTLTPTGRSSSSSKLAAGETININTANAEDLDKLYGIGPTKAQAIIDYRNEHGPFQSTEDIMKVSGIKEGEFDKIKDNITVR